MRSIWPILLTFLITIGCSSQVYTPPPTPFKETDLVGTWQAKYGTTRIDTLILKADGTYQQKFQAPQLNYFYESPWNEWHIAYSAGGKPKLHLEGMRYYASGIEIGEAGGRNSDGVPVLFIDVDEDEEEVFEMTDKVILTITGDENRPRGIILWHMQIDLDTGPDYFVLVDD